MSNYEESLNAQIENNLQHCESLNQLIKDMEKDGSKDPEIWIALKIAILNFEAVVKRKNKELIRIAQTV